jgi:hypothetical protein
MKLVLLKGCGKQNQLGGQPEAHLVPVQQVNCICRCPFGMLRVLRLARLPFPVMGSKMVMQLSLPEQLQVLA